MAMVRTNWSDDQVSNALVWLTLDDRKGNPTRQHALPQSVYCDVIAPFLHFDETLPNQLYALGGRNQEQGPLATVEMFDTWHGRWVACPSMAVRRAGCAAAVLSDNRMLVVGGYDESGIVKGLLASCEAFDPVAETWDSRIASLQRPRWGHGCVCLGGLAYAVGGCSLRPGAPPREAFMETLRSCEVWNPFSNSWAPCADLNMARAGARVLTLGDRFLVAVGGCDDVFGRAEMLPTVELFDVSLGKWSLLDAQLSTPRTTAAVAAIDDRRMLVFGGAPSLASGEVFSIPGSALFEDDSCRKPPKPVVNGVMDMSEGRMGCQAVTISLPAPGSTYPVCNRTCVIVAGGENGAEDWEYDQQEVRQFGSVLVYDTESDEWRPEAEFPPMPTARTAMSLCVGHGKIAGYR